MRYIPFLAVLVAACAVAPIHPVDRVTTAPAVVAAPAATTTVIAAVPAQTATLVTAASVAQWIGTQDRTLYFYCPAVFPSKGLGRQESEWCGLNVTIMQKGDITDNGFGPNGFAKAVPAPERGAGWFKTDFSYVIGVGGMPSGAPRRITWFNPAYPFNTPAGWSFEGGMHGVDEAPGIHEIGYPVPESKAMGQFNSYQAFEQAHPAGINVCATTVNIQGVLHLRLCRLTAPGQLALVGGP